MDGPGARAAVSQGFSVGHCGNEFYCELASADAAISVLPGAPFICPECGKPLQPVHVKASERRRPRMPLAILGGLLAAASLAGYFGLHRLPPALPPPVRPPVPSPVVSTEPVATGTMVLDALEARPLTSAMPEIAVGTVEAPPPAEIAVTGPLAIPLKRDAAPAAKRPPKNHRSRAIAVGSSRQSNPFVIAGGDPSYPENLPAGMTSGTVHVSCQIAASGAPSDCQADGAGPFRRAVLTWLNSGHLRLAPARHKGLPVAGRQSWDIYFEDDVNE
jgi:hypothetical protein